MAENTNTSVATKPPTVKDERMCEFIPFGTNDPIRLSANMVAAFIAIPTKSGELPDERDCTRFVMLCKAKRLNPFEGDAFLVGYDSNDGPKFSLITSHQAFLKRAEAAPEYDGMQSGVVIETKFDADTDYSNVVIIRKQGGNIAFEREGDFVFTGEQLVGAWAKVLFKNRTVPMFRRLNRGVFDTQRSRWAKDPGGMIVKCAEADALRSAFPTLLGGLYLEQEMEIKTVTEAGPAKGTGADVFKTEKKALPAAKPAPEPALEPTAGGQQPQEVPKAPGQATGAAEPASGKPVEPAKPAPVPESAPEPTLTELWEAASAPDRKTVKSAVGAKTDALADFEALFDEDKADAVRLFKKLAGKKK